MGLLWEGQIANTSETDSVATMNGRIYANASRSNNTITVSSFYVGHSQASGYWDWEWQTSGYINGALELNAQTKGRTGLTTISGNWYYSGSASRAVGVGTGSGSIGVSANWRSDHYGDASAQQAASVSYPALGSPAGTTGAPETITTTSVSIRNNVTSWGSYATSGSVRSYRATNSGFSGQTYIGTTDNALVNHTGLTSNDEYWFRGWMNNGGGLSNYMGSTRTAITLPKAPTISGVTQVTSSRATIATAQDTGGGRYTITNKYRIKEVGGSYGSWITYTSNEIVATGLKSSTDYEVQVQSVTTAGTTDGGTTTLETKSTSGNFIPLIMR